MTCECGHRWDHHVDPGGCTIGDCPCAAAHSTSRTRDAGTDCTYRIPGDSVHHTRRIEPARRHGDDGRGWGVNATTVTRWQTAAACSSSWPIFDAAADGDETAIGNALDICTSCAVRAFCLADALGRRDMWSVAGGMTADARADLEARDWLQEPPPIERHGRSCATSGRCDCAEGKRAHAAYVKQWRAQGPSHTRPEAESGPFEQLAMEVGE